MEELTEGPAPDQSEPPQGTAERTVPSSWQPLRGRWELDSSELRYVPGNPTWQAGGKLIDVGVSVCEFHRFNRGIIEADVSFSPPFPEGQHGAGIILGFHSFEHEFYYVQFGNVAAYQICKYEPGFGLQPLIQTGSNSHLVADQQYQIQAQLAGQKVEFKVGGVRVLEAVIPRPPVGHQVGLIAAGPAQVRFQNITVEAPAPQAFIVMQFGQQLDHIWERVIERVVRDEGFLPVRADSIFGPNPVLDDIKRLITEAGVIIAEITPLNANVFYEIGFGDALGKPLILLAQEGTKLPFDLSGYRVVFYRDRIGAEGELTDKLRSNLRACL